MSSVSKQKFIHTTSTLPNLNVASKPSKAHIRVGISGALFINLIISFTTDLYIILTISSCISIWLVSQCPSWCYSCCRPLLPGWTRTCGRPAPRSRISRRTSGNYIVTVPKYSIQHPPMCLCNIFLSAGFPLTVPQANLLSLEFFFMKLPEFVYLKMDHSTCTV